MSEQRIMLPRNFEDLDIDGDFIDEHTLTTIISRIRKKIETDERKYIKTAYGMGYQWIGGEAR